MSERNSSGRRLSGTGGGESSGEPLPHIFSQQRKRYVVTPLAIDIHIPLAQSLMMGSDLTHHSQRTRIIRQNGDFQPMQRGPEWVSERPIG